MEVETEFEEEESVHGDRDEGAGQAQEVDSELETAEAPEPPERHVSAGSRTGSDYSVPEANREVWKAFGCGNEAGRILKRLYGPKGTAAASSKVSYPRMPSPSQRWEPQPAPRKPCPQRAAVRVPRATRQPTPDPDDPRNWRAPIPCRKPASEIFAEMEAARPEVPDLKQGRNQAKEKHGLQDRFQFCGGRALPPGAMGHVPVGEMPVPVPRHESDRHQIDENGMTGEQREIFEDLMLAVKRKQARLAEIDAHMATDPVPSKAKTAMNKEALQLRNDVTSCLKDIDKLLELTETS